MVSLSRRNSERCSEIEKMKNKREDRFEAIVDQFVKNDLIAQEEYIAGYRRFADIVSDFDGTVGKRKR